MKKYLFIIICSVFCALSVSAANGPAKRSNRQTVVLSCDLHCQGCCDKIMKNIAFEKIHKPAKVKEPESQEPKAKSSKTDADSGASTPY